MALGKWNWFLEEKRSRKFVVCPLFSKIVADVVSNYTLTISKCSLYMEMFSWKQRCTWRVFAGSRQLPQWMDKTVTWYGKATCYCLCWMLLVECCWWSVVGEVLLVKCWCCCCCSCCWRWWWLLLLFGGKIGETWGLS